MRADELTRSPAGRVRAHTQWSLVWVLIFAGVVGAIQIGKAPIAIPLLRDELGLSLAVAAWVVGIYAAVGAVAGLPAGVLVNILSPRRSVIIGLLIIGVASCSGAAAASGSFLLFTRALEGAGFLMIVVAIPALLESVIEPQDRDVAFSYWPVYFPIGVVAIMLTGPLIGRLGWQFLWLSTGAVALVYAAVVWAIFPRTVKRSVGPGQALSNVGQVLRARGPILLALAFGCYSLQYHALTGLMPAYLVERRGLSVADAGIISAIAVAAGGIGPFSVGFLLRQGIPLWAMVAAGFGFFGIAASGIFNESISVAGVVVLASASLAISSLLPALIYAGAPQFTPSPALLALTLGVVVQANHLGQVGGPAALGAWVENVGWRSAPALFLTIACAGVAVAIGLRHLRARGN
jgi:predicted MFS family arabinose efflux permease